jgi:hypothetical protein
MLNFPWLEEIEGTSLSDKRERVRLSKWFQPDPDSFIDLLSLTKL